MNLTIDELSKKALPILNRYQVRKAGVFGSFARGDNTDLSDLDILVDAPKSLSLFDMIHLQQDLETTLNHPVDLVEYHLLKPHIQERALKEEIRIL